MELPGVTQERRELLRKEAYDVIRMKDRHGKPCWRFVADISLGGIQICTDEPLGEHDEMEMTLHTRNTGQVFHFRARVMWCDPGITGRAGLTFVQMEPGMRDWLANYLGAE